MPALVLPVYAYLRTESSEINNRTLLFLSVIAVSLSIAMRGHASSVSASFVDAKGTSASCMGLPIVVTKCVQVMTEAGLIPEADLGSTGFTVRTSGKDDGAIVKVDPRTAGDSTASTWAIALPP